MRANHYKTGYTGLRGVDIATFLKRSFTTQEDKQAEQLIAMFEAQLCSICNRQFDFSETYSEFFDLPGTKFFTHNFPIASVESVKIGGAEITAVEDDDYFIYENYIDFEYGLYAFRGKKALELEYKINEFWGDEVKYLIIQLVAHAWLNSENAGVATSEIGFAAVREVYALDKFEKDTKAVINLYRKRLI